MKYSYDKETDTMLIRLRDERPDFAEQAGNVITHYSREKKPVEIEILNASRMTIDMLRAMLPEKVPTKARA